jgi:hypothetical protein
MGSKGDDPEMFLRIGTAFQEIKYAFRAVLI